MLLGTPYSVDRSEEVVMEGYRTTTLDLKRRNKSSVPYADTEDDVRINLTSFLVLFQLIMVSMMVILAIDIKT